MTAFRVTICTDSMKCIMICLYKKVIVNNMDILLQRVVYMWCKYLYQGLRLV